jgi:hypothetical protein
MTPQALLSPYRIFTFSPTRRDPFTCEYLFEIEDLIMEDNMDIDTLDQRGTKRAVEETESQEPPRPKKIKVSNRAVHGSHLYYRNKY